MDSRLRGNDGCRLCGVGADCEGDAAHGIDGGVVAGPDEHGGELGFEDGRAGDFGAGREGTGCVGGGVVPLSEVDEP